MNRLVVGRPVLHYGRDLHYGPPERLGGYHLVLLDERGEIVIVSHALAPGVAVRLDACSAWDQPWQQQRVLARAMRRDWRWLRQVWPPAADDR